MPAAAASQPSTDPASSSRLERAQIALETGPLLLRRHRLEYCRDGLRVRCPHCPLPELPLEFFRRELARKLSLLAQALSDNPEVPARVLDRAEVGQPEAGRLPFEDPIDRPVPQIEVDIGWRR